MIKRTATVAAVGCLLLIAALCVFAPPVAIAGQAGVADVTVTVSSRTEVHLTGGGGCYVHQQRRYPVALLGGGVVSGRFGAGRLAGDHETCVFSTTLPALPAATELVVNGLEHDVHGGVGRIVLSADDGQWSPLKSMRL